jgi:predicted nucleic acid-binding Zn ribbon protein
VTHRRRSPRQFGLAVDRLRGEWEPQTLLAEVQRVWPEAVGDGIATQAQPTGERAGVLTVSCSGSVWAQELDLMAPAILERLNQSLNGNRIARLRCIAIAPPGRG